MASKIICKYCKSLNVIKNGFRKNTFGDVQKYHCKDCGQVFSMNRNFRMRYPKKIRDNALMLRSKLGMSFGEISKELFNNTHIKVSRTTIMSWIKEDIEKKADEL